MTRLWLPLAPGEWRDLRVIDAADAFGTPGLDVIALRVRRGLLPPHAPVLCGVHPMDAGYPDALIAAPIDEATARELLRGDRTTLGDCLALLDDALDLFRAQLRGGRLN